MRSALAILVVACGLRGAAILGCAILDFSDAKKAKAHSQV